MRRFLWIKTLAAQLDAQRISSTLHLGLTEATSTELQEALREDLIVDAPAINEMRRNTLWASQILTFQWQFVGLGR